MYKNFFGLRENPFNVNPDPRFLCLGLQTQKALDELIYGIQNRKGLILLTGEAGTGKTTLINCLLDWLRHWKMPTAFIFNSHLSVKHLFEFILTDFGITIDIQLESNLLMRLNTWLIECFRAGKSPVLIVDEAQGLSLKLLEEIRLLLNLETASEKLLQIVLAGQPELEDKLKRPELRQLRQRITLRCNTRPLTLEESHDYIKERLRIGGAQGDPIFASDALDAVHFYSQGIPRVINLLCEHALINAYVENFRLVPMRVVKEAAREFFLDEGRPFAKKEANLQQPSHATSLAESAAFDAVEKPALTTRNSIVTTAQHGEAISASMVNSNAPVTLKDLIPASAGPEVKPKESALCLDSIARVSDSAASLNTERKRNQVKSSAIPPLHLIRSRAEDESSSTAKGSPISIEESRTLTLDTINQLRGSSPRTVIHALLRSWKSWSSRWVTGFLPTISLGGWSRASLVSTAARGIFESARQNLKAAATRVGATRGSQKRTGLVTAKPALRQINFRTSRRTWLEFAPVAVLTAVITLFLLGLATHREVRNAAATDVRQEIAAPNDAAKATTPSPVTTTSSISDVGAETAKAQSTIVDAPPPEKAEGVQHAASEANPVRVAERGNHDVSEARSSNVAARPTEKPSRRSLVSTAIHGVDNRLRRPQPPKQAGRFAAGVESRPLQKAKLEASSSRPPVPPPLEVKVPEPASLTATRSADVRPVEPSVKATAAPPVKQQVTPAALTGFVTVLAGPYPSLRVDGPSSKKQRQGASLQLGHLLSRVEPVYPEEAKRQGIQGTVKLHAVVDRYGSVKSLQPVSGPSLLGAAVMKAVRQWQYTETKLAGQLVETEVDVAVVFRLSNPAAPKS